MVVKDEIETPVILQLISLNVYQGIAWPAHLVKVGVTVNIPNVDPVSGVVIHSLVQQRLMNGRLLTISEVSGITDSESNLIIEHSAKKAPGSWS